MYVKKIIPYEKSFASHEKSQSLAPGQRMETLNLVMFLNRQVQNIGLNVTDEKCGHDFDGRS